MSRLLPMDEWHKLREPIKQCFGQDKEIPEGALFCAVKEGDQGDIKGFLFLQLALHIEPFGSIDHASFSELKEVIDSALTDTPNIVYYLYADNPIGVEKFKSKGFTPIGVLLSGKPQCFSKTE